MIFNLIIRILSSSIYSRLSQDGVRSRQYGRWLESQAMYALSTYSDHIGRNKNHESMHYNSTHPHYNHHRHHQYRYFTTQLLSERSRQFLTPGISCFNLSIYLYRLYTYLIYEYWLYRFVNKHTHPSSMHLTIHLLICAVYMKYSRQQMSMNPCILFIYRWTRYLKDIWTND